MLVVETYPLCSQEGFWHSAVEYVSAKQQADQGRQSTPLLHGGGEPATEIRESRATASGIPGRNQRQSASGLAQDAGRVR